MKFFLLLCILMFSSITFARNFTSAVPENDEYANLPEYCQVRLTHKIDKKVASVKDWQEKMGYQNYMSLHHLCFAENSIQRAKLYPDQRKKWLSASLGDLNYMEKAATKDFYLLPKIYYFYAYVAEKQGDIKKSVAYAEKAIKKNKKYLKPYLLLADLYIDTENMNAAQEILDRAKKQFPKSRAVKRRLKKIK